MNGTGERFYRLEFLVLFLATPATDGSRKKNGRARGNLVGIPMGKVVAIDSPLAPMGSLCEEGLGVCSSFNSPKRKTLKLVQGDGLCFIIQITKPIFA